MLEDGGQAIAMLTRVEVNGVPNVFIVQVRIVRTLEVIYYSEPILVLDMVRWISKISVSFSEACIPDSEKACLDAINSLGLEEGGRGYAFAGDYGTKGCYAYEAENTKYGNMAFYGTGGSEDEMKTILAKPQYRPMIDSCGVTGLFWFFMQIFVVICLS